MSSVPPPPPPPWNAPPPPPPPAPPSGGGGGGFDFGRGLKFFFEDPDWVRKIAFGGLFALLGSLLVGLPFVAGYYIRVTQRTARGEALPLPEWDDFGGIFTDGIKAVGVALAYALVLMLPLGCVFGLVAAMAGAGGQGSDAAGAVAGLAIVAGYGLMMVGGLALTVYMPSALTRFALADCDFGTAFQVGENFDFIKRNLVPYLLAVVLYLLCSFIAQFGVILCCIGIFPASFWAYCVLGWGMGEVARQDPSMGR